MGFLTKLSQIRGLRSTKCSSEILQNLLYENLDQGKKNYMGFLIVHAQNIEIFEEFGRYILLSANLLFLKTVPVHIYLHNLIVLYSHCYFTVKSSGLSQLLQPHLHCG